MQEENAAGKSEREKAEATTTWRGLKAWVRKHDMTFDTLKALQLAGWVFLTICPYLYDAINVFAFFHLFPNSESAFIPALSLLASLLYAALALAFYFELL